MKPIAFISLLLLSYTGLKSQTTEEAVSVKPFKKINISGAPLVEYTQSDTMLVTVVASPDDRPHITVSSDGETLVIKTKGTLKGNYSVKVRSHQLNDIVCAGASRMVSTNTIQADSLNIDATGASSLHLDLKANALNVIAGGASSIELSGDATNFHSNIGGASTLKAYKLNADNAWVVAGGASTAKLYAINKINANATGASTIKFKGDPKDVSVEATTASSVLKVAGDDSQKRLNGPGRDSTTFNFKKKKIIIIGRDYDHDKDSIVHDDFHHWAGFSMGVNGWLSNGSFNLPQSKDYMSLNYGKSLNFQLNPIERNFHLYKNYINLVTGIGFEWNQYELSNNVKLNADSSFTSGKHDTTGISYRKNRLKSTFVNVPLMVEFNTNKNPNKAFHVAVGVIGGYKLGSRTRQVYSLNGSEVRDVRKDDYNINPIRVNAHLSLGYSNWTLYADYALTPLFENGKGPGLNPVTIGLRIIPF